MHRLPSPPRSEAYAISFPSRERVGDHVSPGSLVRRNNWAPAKGSGGGCFQTYQPTARVDAEFAALTARGMPVTGTEQYGGPIVTRGGLVFIAATQDAKFRAFDKRTGRLLWEAALPAPGYATPSTFAVAGKQFVVVAAGGGKLGSKSSDAYVAYSLP